MMAEYTNNENLMELQRQRQDFYKSQHRKEFYKAIALLVLASVLMVLVMSAFYYLDKKGIDGNGNYITAKTGNAYIHMSSASKEEVKNA